MKLKFRFSGRGGQGIKFLGTLLAQVGMDANYYATLTVDYTPSVRGGPIFSDVILSTDPISFPFCDKDADVFIAIDQQGIERSVDCIYENTVSFIDSNTVNNIEKIVTMGKIHRVPITKRADEAKLSNYANIVSLGFLSKYLNKRYKIDLNDEHYYHILNKMPEKFRDVNIRSFELGKNLFTEITI
jgi:Pyruvate/2-oxoacid:ferredoxin oxidoreductase gamma subunit